MQIGISRIREKLVNCISHASHNRILCNVHVCAYSTLTENLYVKTEYRRVHVEKRQGISLSRGGGRAFPARYPRFPCAEQAGNKSRAGCRFNGAPSRAHRVLSQTLKKQLDIAAKVRTSSSFFRVASLNPGRRFARRLLPSQPSRCRACLNNLEHLSNATEWVESSFASRRRGIRRDGTEINPEIN